MGLWLRRLGQRVALHHVLFLGFTLIAAVPVALLGAWVQQSAFRMSVAALQRGDWQPEIVELLNAMHFNHVCLISRDGRILEWLPIRGGQPGPALPDAMLATLGPLIAEA
jgi:hypothetical protein